MSSFKPTRAFLTFDEIRELELKYKGTEAYADIKRLTRHARFVAGRLHVLEAPPCPKCSGTGMIHKNCIMR